MPASSAQPGPPDGVVPEAAPGRGFGTRAVHGVPAPVPAEPPLATPIWQTSAFAFGDADRYAQALRQPREGYVYTRYENPTTAALEAVVANLEGAAQGMATASGMGAIATVLLTLAAAGDHLVVQRDLYGGTFSLLTTVAARLGIGATFVDATDPVAVEAALRPVTRAIYVETIANPTMTVADLPALAGVARAAGIPLVVDNTVASPYLCRPIAHGAAVVVHSATKYLGGHSDVIGGLALFADAGRHGQAWKTMIDLGASPDPFAAWLVLRGVKTLPLRMERHTRNAGALAGLLADHPKVARVYWPGLPGHPSHAVATRVLDGYGGFLSFDLAGGREAGRRFTEATRVALLAPSLGGPETLVSHPASTTHRQLDARALESAGIGEGMVRVSAGLEDADDLLEDFTRALEAA
jgi:cystathionine beta-lyase/cystathionine gamma-synthase